ncbi:hypothetical protein OG492_01795 [Streptomyces chartreusis]
MPLTNLYSYRKETQFEDGPAHNAIAVTENFSNCSPEAARDVVTDLMTARLNQFHHTVEQELPTLYDQLTPGIRAALASHVDMLLSCMSANLYWHQHTRRYDESTLIRSNTPGPAPLQSASVFLGITLLLGTSALRIRPAHAVPGRPPI